MNVSIALTTFNGAQYLKEQLDSYLAQTRLADELVVCDDCSNDDTVRILMAFAEVAPFPVRIFQNPQNLGFIQNFEQVVSKCVGDIVFLSDQDDVWHPEKIARVEKIFEANSRVQLVVHDGELADEHLVTHGATKLNQVVRGFGSTDSHVMGALTAVHRALIRRALPFPRIVGHDVWLHKVAGLLQARYVLRSSLQTIRRHGLNTSNWVASSIKTISRLDAWRSQYRSATANSYEDRLVLNDCCRVVIERVEVEEDTFGPDVLKEAQMFLALERRALLARDELARTTGLRQKVLSLRLLCRGDYRFFNGYMSFLRDVSR
jgi:glycosyltransferase involved in cell wall biosynthesis